MNTWRWFVWCALAGLMAASCASSKNTVKPSDALAWVEKKAFVYSTVEERNQGDEMVNAPRKF